MDSIDKHHRLMSIIEEASSSQIFVFPAQVPRPHELPQDDIITAEDSDSSFSFVSFTNDNVSDVFCDVVFWQKRKNLALLVR